jgi:hexosaminidase
VAVTEAITGTDSDAAASLGLVPRPSSVSVGESWYELSGPVTVDADEASASAVAWLRARLAAASGWEVRDAGGAAGSGGEGAAGGGAAIVLRGSVDGLSAEGYRLRVRDDGVLIEAGGPAGAFYGAQTLRALLPAAAYREAPAEPAASWRIRHVEIEDAPRFGWRGTLLDVARHFLPKHDLLRFIDLIALHKLNVLHLHLTDDQGWRVEIRGHPQLTDVGGWRHESPLGDRRNKTYDGRPHGGYYTQDDLREIIAYAKARHVTIVPEIDLPGHTGAAIAAYPWLGNTDVPGWLDEPQVGTSWGIFQDVLNLEQRTLDLLFEILDQVMDLFPAEHVGIGGDECPTVQWEISPRAKARIRELGIDGVDGVQSWYAAQLAGRLATRGRKALVWDELCEGELPPQSVVASWRGYEGAEAAASRGHDTVVCPQGWVYFDYRQSESLDEPVPVGTVTPLERVYAFEPVPQPPTDALSDHVIGAQCQLWTEHMDSVRSLDYMTFPRLCAFAETVWSARAGSTQGRGEAEYADFLRRLSVHEQRLDALGVEYRHASGPLPWQQRPDAPGFSR